MVSSDDEAEALPKIVSNYDFVDDKDEPISFSAMPILWSETETFQAQKQQVFLSGTADNGLQKIYKPVSAWRFDISNAIPEIWVLSKENNWIKVQKPRKSYENIIRTTLITVHSLHHVKRNPDVSGRSLWDHLSRFFSLFEVRPSLNDLVDHMPLISEAVKRDENLGKSQFLLTFLEERPMKRLSVEEGIRAAPKSAFIVDDRVEIYDDMNDVGGDGSDEDEDLFDSVCAICDNGGNILCCEGKCLRSFHPTDEDGEESLCETLGYSREQLDAIENFVCKNCECKQQQCFICGKLGSSDKSRGAEVFLCANATCGHYYHPHCVSRFEHKENVVAAEELQKKITAGQSFTCPIHKCCVCKQGENKKDPHLQFAVCRRCPKSYHRKCLPREIAFQDIEEEDIEQRAWEDLLPNRILIYCLKHEIDEELGTPVRDHIVFPGDREQKTKVDEKKKKPSLEMLARTDKLLSKKRNIASGDSFRERSLLKTSKLSGKFSAGLREGGTVKSSKKVSAELNFTKKRKLLGAPGKSLHGTVRSASTNANKYITSGSKPSLGDQLYEYYKGSEPVKPKKGDPSNSDLNKAVVKPAVKNSSFIKPELDADSQKRILALMKESASSITLVDIVKKHKVPSTHAQSSKYIVDKNITIGKVEGAVEAVRTALQKLEEGCSVEDARAVCEPEIVNQIFRWQNKLKVYLAPFLHGMRYTSFGRHFTKVEKLQEIVDKLHWYVQNGDTIVDFCCGANDFSWLMRKKLEEVGKKCSYRNFDCIQPKNDFNFEKRDWMTVQPKELPIGSQLIMGLNPPFGVKAALANKFIDKALEFKPKLLILIVPPESERLDKKKSPYDLVWEDDQSLSGKSFYLPGSVDANDKQMEQWNCIAPPLYLWSRRDWTIKHKDIASKHGHIRMSDQPMEDCDTSKVTDNLPTQNDKVEVNGRGADHGIGIGDRERLENPSGGNIHPDDVSRKRKHGDDKNVKPTDEKKLEHGNIASRKENSPSNVAVRKEKSPSIVAGRGKNQSGDADIKKTRTSNEKHVRVSNERKQQDNKRQQGGRPRPHQSPSNLINDRPKTRDETDDMGRRYNFSGGGDEACASGDQRWFRSLSPLPEFAAPRSLDGQILGHMRDGVDTLGYNRPYMSELDRDYAIPDIRSQIQLYGRQQDPEPVSVPYRGGYAQMGHAAPYRHEPDVSYRMNAPADMSYRMNANTSVMQRYAARLDESNYNNNRMNPAVPNRNGTYEARAQPTGYQPEPVGYPPGYQPDPVGYPSGYRPDPVGFPYQPDSMGFAPGFQHPSSQNNSGGWLDD